MSTIMLHCRTRFGCASHARRIAIACALALSAGGCAQGALDLSAVPNLAPAGAASDATGPATLAEPAAHAPRPPIAVKEPATRAKAALAPAIEQARKLRLAGDKSKALQVLDSAAEKDPKDKAIAKERGLLALELGKVQRAEQILRAAFDPGDADWRLHSGLGSALAAQGKQPEAQLQFAKALELAPDHPSVLNNLALSYALDGKHDEAERLLKRITKTRGVEPKAQQNLALILGLKGKIGEARTLSEAALPPETARVNVGYLESLGASGERARLSRAEPAPQSAVAAADTPR